MTALILMILIEYHTRPPEGAVHIAFPSFTSRYTIMSEGMYLKCWEQMNRIIQNQTFLLWREASEDKKKINKSKWS